MTTPTPTTPAATTPAASGSPLVIPGSLPLVPTAAPAQMVRPVRTAKPADKYGWWWGTGRRKAAVARIRMKPAGGDKATVIIEAPNGKEEDHRAVLQRAERPQRRGSRPEA